MAHLHVAAFRDLVRQFLQESLQTVVPLKSSKLVMETIMDREDKEVRSDKLLKVFEDIM